MSAVVLHQAPTRPATHEATSLSPGLYLPDAAPSIGGSAVAGGSQAHRLLPESLSKIT